MLQSNNMLGECSSQCMLTKQYNIIHSNSITKCKKCYDGRNGRKNQSTQVCIAQDPKELRVPRLKLMSTQKY